MKSKRSKVFRSYGGEVDVGSEGNSFLYEPLSWFGVSRDPGKTLTLTRVDFL